MLEMNFQTQQDVKIV